MTPAAIASWCAPPCIANAGTGDFSLPKGQVERGESLPAAALREVLASAE